MKPTTSSKGTLGIILSLAACILPGQLTHAQSSWAGGNGAWSSNGSPGWNGTGVPNAVGATATHAIGTNSTITQDVAAGVTVGSILKTGTLGSSANFTVSNLITLNQDGAGAGVATISNANTFVGVNALTFSSGTLALADDLLVSNTGGSTSANGSIQIGSVMSGTGNVTFSTVSNSLSAGYIRLTGANTYTGSVLVRKGAISFNTATAFGSASNVITLGESGQGSVNVQASSSGLNVANNIVVAASTGGTTTLGSTSISTGNSIFSGSILLNGDLTVSSSQTGAGRVDLQGAISGVGDLTKVGTGILLLSGSNTYTGDTIVSAGTVNLADNARLNFSIGASGVNNQVNGVGAANFSGDFTFDLSGAAAVGSWTIVDTASLTEAFTATFTVVGFTDNLDNTWTSGNYTFSELTGVLTAVPEPGTIGLIVVGACAVLFFRKTRRY